MQEHAFISQEAPSGVAENLCLFKHPVRTPQGQTQGGGQGKSQLISSNPDIILIWDGVIPQGADPKKAVLTESKVKVIPLRGLSQEQQELARELRSESAQVWNQLLALFTEARTNDTWPNESELKNACKGQYKLYSQSVQALCEKFMANIDSARSNRQNEYQQFGYALTEYPYHHKQYMTTVWKRESIYTTESGLRLSNGPKQDALLVRIPALYRQANISRAELLYEAGKYSLALTIDTGVELPQPMEPEQGIICGGDLGEVHMVSLTDENGETLIISGRALRSFKQWRNKVRARCAKALEHCEPGSRRYQRLLDKRNQISAKARRQQRDYLHKAAKLTVDFLVAQGVSVLYLGDVRNAADRVNLGKRANQKISQWVHGEFRALVTEKARRVGITVLLIDESYSTKTCCYCSHRRKSSPSGRTYSCTASGCKVKLHRDANGSCNIVSYAVHGKYGKTQPTNIKYLQPLNLKYENRRQGSSGAEPAHVASIS